MTRRPARAGAPEGGLVVDKAAGLTSHDVVALARRALGQPRIGHTGTLDPLATGVLPLLLGRATRLARFLAADRKTYEATVRFGQATSTYDAEGEPAGPAAHTLPRRETVEEALQRFRGRYEQKPPAVSAKKVGDIAPTPWRERRSRSTSYRCRSRSLAWSSKPSTERTQGFTSTAPLAAMCGHSRTILAWR